MSFTINVIGTGSAGNAVVIDNALMIDAGLPVRELKEHLATVSAVFVTHQHGDHIRPAVVNHLARHRPVLLQRRFFVNESTRTALQVSLPKQVHTLAGCPSIDGHGWRTSITTPNGTSYGIEAFRLVHDVENYGFVVTRGDGHRLIYATDTETMRYAPPGPFDAILVEGNWDEDKFTEMIRSHDLHVQQRALQNLRHMSVQKFEEFVNRNGHADTVSYQMHVSDDLGSRALVGTDFTTERLKVRLQVV